MPQVVEEKSVVSEKAAEVNDLELGSNEVSNATNGKPKAINFSYKIGLRYGPGFRGIERVSNESSQKTSFLLPLTMLMSPNLAISALSTSTIPRNGKSSFA